MKSGKQRRQELQTKKQQKIARKAQELAEKQRLASERDAAVGVRINADALAPDGSYSSPQFVTRGYYLDKPFDCQTCGKAQVWTATQQKWWYEVAKGGVWTTARLCRACRQKERVRRESARQTHLEGLAKKRGAGK